MNFYREIKFAKNEDIVVKIPKEFINQEIEIIILPSSITHEKSSNLERFDRIKALIKQNPLSLDGNTDIIKMPDEANRDIF